MRWGREEERERRAEGERKKRKEGRKDGRKGEKKEGKGERGKERNHFSEYFINTRCFTVSHAVNIIFAPEI